MAFRVVQSRSLRSPQHSGVSVRRTGHVGGCSAALLIWLEVASLCRKSLRLWP